MAPTALLSALLSGTAPATSALPLAAPPQVQDRQQGGRSADPVPLQPTPVRVRSLEVELVEVPVQDGWRVTAVYDLYNPSAAQAVVQLLLPEEGCPRDRPCSPMPGAFQDLGIRLGDQLIEPVPAEAAAMRAFADPPGEGHQFRATVPPRQARRLSIEYRLDRSRGAQHWGVHHLSSIGRWGGPVDRLRYVIELAQPVPHVLYPKALRLAEFAEVPGEPGAGARTRLVFVAEGVTTRMDLLAAFPDDLLVGRTAEGFCDGFRGDLADGELRPLLKRYTPKQRRACCELVHALHGFPFPDPTVRARHYGATPPLPAWAEARGLTVVARPENPGFRPALLSPGELSYLRALGGAPGRCGGPMRQARPEGREAAPERPGGAG